MNSGGNAALTLALWMKQHVWSAQGRGHAGCGLAIGARGDLGKPLHLTALL